MALVAAIPEDKYSWRLAYTIVIPALAPDDGDL
jgi:hypothetical protein